MMFWFTLLIWVVTTVAAEIIRPKPTFEDARPSSLGDFNFPTATEGRAIPVVWGRVKVQGPNVVWYGHFRKSARTENVSTGLFSDEDVIIGYRYYIGIQFALCHGPVDSLRNVWINEKSMNASALPGNGVTISNPNLFGGEEHGSGGVSGTLRFYGGDLVQPVNPYLDARITDPVPAYRGTCYAVWEGGWVGNSSSLAPFAFEVERIPDGLNLEAVDAGSSKPNLYDCNPMNVLYEILIDTDWGLSINIADIDIVNFKAAAATLYAEGNGFSMILDSATEVSTMIEEIQRQIDGTLFFNRGTAQWQVKLARDDYTPADLDIYDETNIVELKEFTRQTWEETTNQVRVTFVDRNDEYKSTFSLAQDPANMDIQGQSVQSDINYPGVKVGQLANDLAWRDLRTLSYPLSKIAFTVNRTAWELAPGAVFKFSWERLGITEEIYRVGKISYGRIDANTIEITAFQDIFATSAGVYSNPTSTVWDDIDTPALPPDELDSLIFEAPRQMILGNWRRPANHPTVWAGARLPSEFTTAMQMDIDSGSARPLPGSFVKDSDITQFLIRGLIDTAVDANQSEANPQSGLVIVKTDVDDLDPLVIDGTASLIRGMTTLAWVNGEIIGFETCTLVSGDYRLGGVWRGLFNTAERPMAVDDEIWFISVGGSHTASVLASTHDEVDLQLRGKNVIGDLTASIDSDILPVSLVDLYLCPLSAYAPHLHNVWALATANIDTSYLSGTGRAFPDSAAIKVDFSVRDWTQDDITLDRNLGETWGDFSEEFDVSLVLDPSGTPITVGPYLVDTFTLGVPDSTYVLRNDIIKAVGANATIPTDAETRFLARHTVDGTVYTNPTDMIHYHAISSAGLIGSDDLTHGAVDDGTSPSAVVYGETGTYTFDIYTALPSSGKLQARINSGSWVDVVLAAASTGTLSVTATDSIELKFTVAPAADQFFDITGPTAELGYGVLEA